jgi:hypothetical protein
MLMDKPYDESIDVYSFGILMAQVITSSQPYSHINIKKIPIPVLNKQIIEGSRPLLDILVNDEENDDKSIGNSGMFTSDYNSRAIDMKKKPENKRASSAVGSVENLRRNRYESIFPPSTLPHFC